MKLKTFIATILLTFGMLFQLHAQEFYLLKSTDQNIDLKIGENKVVFFQFKSFSNKYENLDIVYHTSDKLNITTTTGITKIDSNETKNLFLSITPRPAAKFGKDTLLIEIRNNKLLIDVILVYVNILQKKDLKITALSTPEFLEPNSEFLANFLVLNNGNSEEKLELNSMNGGKTNPKSLNLKPGQSQIVEVKYSIPAAENDVKLMTIMLSAQFAQSTEIVSKSFSLPLLPSSIIKKDPYLRFPIEASTLLNTYNANGKSQSGFQFDFRGKGYLDFEKKHDFEFIIHGPSQFTMPRFGTFDQYYAGYSYQKNTLRIGDNSYKVSNLLEFSRFGRGIEFSKTIKQNTYRAYYLAPRFFNDIKSQKALVIDRKVSEDLILSFNVLNKKHIVKEKPISTNLLSVSGSYKKANLWSESELSLSKTRDLKTKFGFYSNVYYTKNEINISSNVILAPKDFFGFYDNSILVNNTIHYTYSKKIRVGAIHNLSQINPSLDAFYFTVAPYSNSLIAELSYDYSNNHKFRFNLVSRTREDRMPIKTYDFKENLVRHTYYGKLGDFLIQADGDIGRTQNKLAESNLKSKGLFRQRIQSTYSLNKDIQFGGFVEYLNTNRYSDNNKNQNYVYYGSNVAWNYKNILNFSLFYRNNYAPDELFSSQSFFDSQVEFNFKNHNLSFSASHSFFPAPVNEKSIFISLKYTYKLNTPIKKRKDLGELVGSLNGVNKKGVILQLNGERVISDDLGNFSFKDLTPGKYILEVKKSSLPFGTIIDQKTPIEVVVEANSIKSLSLTTIKTGKVSGQIIANSTEKNSTNSLENILIKIYKDDFSIITLTNKYGEFSFSELKEGTYKAKIVSETLKNKFSFKNNDFSVNVEDGKIASCIFVLEEKKKNIKFQNQVITLSGL